MYNLRGKFIIKPNCRAHNKAIQKALISKGFKWNSQRLGGENGSVIEDFFRDSLKIDERGAILVYNNIPMIDRDWSKEITLKDILKSKHIGDV